MSVYLYAHSAACRRLAGLRRQRIPLAMAALALSMAGCSQLPQVAQGPDPSSVDATAPATTYRPVIQAYQSRRPVAPTDWRGSNDGVAPKKDAR